MGRSQQREAWELDPWDQPRILELAEDGGRRYVRFWDWVATHDPRDPAWHLDTIAVAPELRGRGIGRALIEAGLERARADGRSAFLSTGTAANTAIYDRCGFREYDEARRTGRRSAHLVHALGPMKTDRRLHRGPAPEPHVRRRCRP